MRSNFKPNGSGGYETPPGLNATLTRDSLSQGTLRFNRNQTKLFFQADGRLDSITDQNNNKISLTYSTTAPYQLTGIYDTQDQGAQNPTLAFTYTNGKLTKVTDRMTPDDREWTYTYEGNDLKTYKDPEGHTTTYDYDFGKLDKIIDPELNVTEIDYVSGSQDKVESITRFDAATGAPDPVTSFSYTPYGSGGSECTVGGQQMGKTVVTDPNNHQATYCWDDQDRVVKVIDANGDRQSSTYNLNSEVNRYTGPSNAMSNLSTFYTYSPSFGKRLEEVTTVLDGATPPALMTTNLGYASNDPNNFRSQYPSSVTNEQGNTTTFGYDDNGNITSVADQAPGAVTLERDRPDKQVTKSIDGNGNETTYEYTGKNLTRIVPPSPLGDTVISYDSVRRVKTVQDGKDQVRALDYDDLDRIERVTFGDGSKTEFVYDKNGNAVTRKDIAGGQTKMTTYTYDDLHRLTGEDFPDSSAADNTYTYDPAGNLTAIKDGENHEVRYGYDPGNRMTSVAEPGGNCGQTPVKCTRVSYPPMPLESGEGTITRTLPSGFTVATTLDPAGRTKEVLSKKSDGTTVQEFDYTYTLGTAQTALVQSVKRNGLTTTTYTYDQRDRLATAAIPKPTGGTDSYEYRYDKANNRYMEILNGTTTSAAFNKANELCWQAPGDQFPTEPPVPLTACPVQGPSGATTYSHDANGNLRTSTPPTGSGLNFEYNAKDQTTKAIRPGELSANTIKYRGPNQIERIQATDTTGNTVDFRYNVLGMSQRVNHPDKFIRTEDGQLIGRWRSDASEYYYLSDALGSITGIVDENQTLQRTYRYDPYGNVIENTDHTGSAPTDYFRFAGGFYAEGGLYHFAMRYYDPKVGRWTQQDPIELIDDLREVNRYGYVGANPVNFVDREGMFISKLAKKAKKGFRTIGKAAYSFSRFRERNERRSTSGRGLQWQAVGVGCGIAIYYANAPGVGFCGVAISKLASGD